MARSYVKPCVIYASTQYCVSIDPRLGSTDLHLVLLDIALFPPTWDKSQGHDAGDMHLGTKDLAVQTKLLYRGLQVLKTFLVVGASTSHPDLNYELC